MTVAAGRLYVMVVDRAAAEGHASRAWVYRLVAGRWSTAGAKPIPVNRGAMVTLLGGARPCVVAPYRREVDVRCEMAAGVWRRVGRPVFKTTAPNPVTGYDGAFTSEDRIFVLRAHLQQAHGVPGGVGVSGRLEHTVFRLDGGRWRRDGGADIDRTAPGGTQRPFGFTLGKRPCLAYDRIPGDPHAGPDIAVVCEHDDAWVAEAPALHLADIGRDGARAGSAIGIDGALVTGGGQLLVGVDDFAGAHVSWRIEQLSDGRWGSSALANGSPEWNSQGSLYAIGGEAWAIRFDQRPGAHGLRTRLVVRSLDEAGAARTVGPPLLRDARFFGPLYYGLARTSHRTYAMATVPKLSRRKNEVRVFVLR